MSLIFDILKELWDQELNYKGVRVNLFGVPTFLYKNKRSVYSSLYRLKRDGYISRKGESWNITATGREYVSRKQSLLKEFDSPFQKSDKRDLLILFDIPEQMKHKREWLRTQLKKYNYIMVQRSVWVGPSPIPKEFKDYLKDIKLNKTILTFKLSKPYKAKR